jgi:hypothetical protein
MLLIGNIQCVILNACYSIGQAEAISQHIDFVIGMKSSISDAKAICFSKTFYQALGYGKCIRDAFDSANAQLEVEGLSADQLPILLSKGNGSNINGDLDLSNNHGLELQPQEFNASILWLETLHPVLREHLLDPLEMRYQVVLEMRIGTIGRKKHSYSEIARFFNVYPGRVRIYETQALSKITVLVRNDWQHWNKII